MESRDWYAAASCAACGSQFPAGIIHKRLKADGLTMSGRSTSPRSISLKPGSSGTGGLKGDARRRPLPCCFAKALRGAKPGAPGRT